MFELWEVEERSDHLTGVATRPANKGSLPIFCPRCVVKIPSACHFLLTLEAKEGLPRVAIDVTT